MKYTYILFILFLGLNSCSGPESEPLFRLVPIEKSNVDFINQIQETEEFNILTDEFMYNGGGIGVGDFNLDGLYDLYFTGNQVPNRLYLNEGYMKFRDITEEAGVGAADIWSSGVSIVDINNDRLPDIYVSATFKDDKEERVNKLYINEGRNANGVPTFSDKAIEFGLADTSYNTHSYFFDYDMDGDLDVFLLNDKLFSPRSTTDLNLLMEGGEATIDKLYRNNGDNTFTDISTEAGITEAGFGLGAAIFDANGDGFFDIYVSNDFISNDLLYINQRDGSFKNQIEDYFKHHSFSSMGIDATDLNGDGKSDLMTLDMLPENRERVKRTYAFQKFQFYDLMEQTGYLMQYNRNSFQMSNSEGRYSEVSEMLGVDASEWSWSVLFADLDNDGHKDLAISNGYPRDITDMDFTDYNSSVNSMMTKKEDLLNQIPIVKVPNYFFKNDGENSFIDKSEAWGISTPSFSNGSVVADLDNDGDLDYVVNNINDPAQIYENRSNTKKLGHSLRLYFSGEEGNRDAIGTQVKVYYDGKMVSGNLLPQRGYLSSIEPSLHFGLGEVKTIDSIFIRWPEGELSLVKEVDVSDNKELRLDKMRMNRFLRNWPSKEKSWFTSKKLRGLNFDHQEVNFYDYNFQGLLQRLHSREGPSMAVGDIDGNGWEDLIIGNGSRASTKIFKAQANGSFREDSLTDVRTSEDQGLLLFDADGDGDLDLYVGTGSTEFRKGSKFFHDKFYLNDGKGNFSLSQESIPQIPISTASVTAADYDNDGDLDIFLAGRIDPQNYPHATNSYLLENEGGQFRQVNEGKAPILNDLGMVSQGLWTDVNQDGWIDLILVGEWMPLSILINQKGSFNDKTEIPQSSGWWNSISGADLDNDGDIDYILGNQGLNNKVQTSLEHPLLIYAEDFDENGSVDPIIAEYQEGDYYPVHLKMDLTRQLVELRKRYSKYQDFASARMEDIFPPEKLKESKTYKAETFESAILWNHEGDFHLQSLPKEAQVSPIYNSFSWDIDQDGDLDIMLQGNRYGTEVFQGRQDASNGLVLFNEGNKEFVYKGNKGFVVDADARSMVSMHTKSGLYLLSGVNDQKPLIYALPNQESLKEIIPEAGDIALLIHYKDGRKQRQEIYHGSGFLSQSSTKFLLNPEWVKEVEIIGKKGSTRKVSLSEN
ncbi:MAG: VCBS repeat-containing protein [Bacteroidia bacterium]|nr:VCBS repeat-containing protein [Bacteroidia bacterium]